MRFFARRHAIPVWGALMLALGSGPAPAAPTLGEPAPSLVVAGLDGATFDLASLRGRVVLVNYWATWCGPCKREMPTLDAFYRRYHARGLDMIGISVDRPRDLEKVRKKASTLAYPAAMLKAVRVDGFGPPEGVPVTWVIDADGIVRDKFIDVRDELLTGVVLPLLPRETDGIK